jgi:hypothetical protein
MTALAAAHGWATINQQQIMALNFPHSIGFSGGRPLPFAIPCNCAGIPPFWVISCTDYLT